METLSPAQKAVRTRKHRLAAAKAVKTKKRLSTWAQVHAAEAASKEAFRAYCKEHSWKVAFFEGETGSPRTGIIDAVAFRLGRKDADLLDVRLVQLKGGNAGISSREITRLKEAAASARVDWLIAELDGEILHLLPGDFD